MGIYWESAELRSPDEREFWAEVQRTESSVYLFQMKAARQVMGVILFPNFLSYLSYLDYCHEKPEAKRDQTRSEGPSWITLLNYSLFSF